ncbi:TetR/AcrR family transcriptional regulator, partial [Phenylobacterium sp.]|uniref:TetR/AcrR family transcriptional regulator n=1 Tax=Phenylobacterium sp. TaxID=1871053 RepID=UPI0027374B5E
MSGEDRALRSGDEAKSRYRYASHETHGLKAKAMSAAAHILDTRGIEELNLRAIAEKAGIGIASMYHYFDNKEGILLSLGVMGFEDLRRDILGTLTDDNSLSPIGASAAVFFRFAETRSEL